MEGLAAVSERWLLDMSEAEEKQRVLVWLSSRPDTFAYIVQPLVARDKWGRVMRAAPKGHSDILACVGGRYVAIEMKSATGRQSPDQKIFQQAVQRASGIYVLSRSIDDVCAAI